MPPSDHLAPARSLRHKHINAANPVRIPTRRVDTFIRGAQLAPVLAGQLVEGQEVLFGRFEQRADLRRHRLKTLQHAADALLGLLIALGLEDLSQRGGDQPALITAAVHDHVAGEVDCASLPWTAQHAGDRGLEPLVLVRDREAHAVQAALVERA
jgi:hypothetical protein